MQISKFKGAFKTAAAQGTATKEAVSQWLIRWRLKEGKVKNNAFLKV